MTSVNLTISATDFRKQLRDLLDAIDDGPIEITKHGSVVAVLVSPSYFEASAEDDSADDIEVSAEDDSADDIEVSAEDDSADDIEASAEDDSADDIEASAEDDSADDIEASSDETGKNKLRNEILAKLIELGANLPDSFAVSEPSDDDDYSDDERFEDYLNAGSEMEFAGA